MGLLSLTTCALMLFGAADAMDGVRHSSRRFAGLRTGTFMEHGALSKGAVYEVIGPHAVSLHEGPSYDTPLTDDFLRKGETFEIASGKRHKEGGTWLQLADGRGWAWVRQNRFKLLRPGSVTRLLERHHHHHQHRKEFEDGDASQPEEKDLVADSKKETEDAKAEDDNGTADLEREAKEAAKEKAKEKKRRKKEEEAAEKRVKEANPMSSKKIEKLIQPEHRHKNKETMTEDWHQEVPEYGSEAEATKGGSQSLGTSIATAFTVLVTVLCNVAL